ncbi:MAG: hypothetical protein H6560_20885 [Lewinellaceae bacterium]|nr:hypothetical protein [Lewinellaceae bacterium]
MKEWPREITPSSFDAEVLACPKPVVVAFLKAGVASGDILIAVFRRFASETKADLIFFRADVERCTEIAHRYRIRKFPMTLVFVKGKVAAHFFGVASTQKIRRLLEGLY